MKKTSQSRNHHPGRRNAKRQLTGQFVHEISNEFSYQDAETELSHQRESEYQFRKRYMDSDHELRLKLKWEK